MRSGFLLAILAVVVFACTTEPATKSKKKVEGVKTEDPNSVAAMIRNPLEMDGQVDSSLLAQIHFDEDRFNFGSIDEGGVIKHTFTFSNSGNIPLIISDVRSTCGCTVAEWPKEPIAPGGTGEIPVQFDTKNKTGKQSKPITITANTYPAKTTLHLDGFVD